MKQSSKVENSLRNKCFAFGSDRVILIMCGTRNLKKLCYDFDDIFKRCCKEPEEQARDQLLVVIGTAPPDYLSPSTGSKHVLGQIFPFQAFYVFSGSHERGNLINNNIMGGKCAIFLEFTYCYVSFFMISHILNSCITAKYVNAGYTSNIYSLSHFRK